MFTCNICEYKTNRLSNLNRHIKSNKHQEVKTCNCGKVYYSRSGYWKHNKKCNVKREKEVVVITNEKSQIINNTTNNIIVNNTNTINYNIQMFLNNRCKNAMTLEDFANNLIFSTEDLKKNKKELMTEVILNSLEPLSLDERPVHCANLKNKKWFINNGDEGWEEDNGDKFIRTTEKGITRNWFNKFNEENGIDKNDNKWMRKEELKDNYLKIVMSTSTDLTANQKTKIKNIVGREIDISKEIKK